MKVGAYLQYDKPNEAYDEIWQLIVNNYDGYRFQPDAKPLFNSTILTYFFKQFATRSVNLSKGMIDENLRTDINWTRRITLNLENAREMLDTLVVDDELTYSLSDLRSKFNRNQFFDKKFYPFRRAKKRFCSSEWIKYCLASADCPSSQKLHLQVELRFFSGH